MQTNELLTYPPGIFSLPSNVTAAATAVDCGTTTLDLATYDQFDDSYYNPFECLDDEDFLNPFGHEEEAVVAAFQEPEPHHGLTWSGYNSWSDWWNGRAPSDVQTSASDEGLASAMVEALDTVGGGEAFEFDLNPSMPARGSRGRPQRRSRINIQAQRGYGWGARMAREAKSQFYKLEHTKANVIVITNYITKRLREAQVSEQSIGDITAVAEALYWVPTQIESEVNRIRASATYGETYRERDAAYRVEKRWLVGRALERLGLLRRRKVHGPKAKA